VTRPKNRFGAELPAEALEDFEKYLSWWRDGAKTEIEVGDEEGIAKARETDPKHVVSLVYRGSMCLWPEFADPDTIDVERWFITEKPLSLGDKILAADYVGDCTLCGASTDDETPGDRDCQMCSGDGSAQYWFEDFVADPAPLPAESDSAIGQNQQAGEGGNSDTQQYDDSERYTKLDDNVYVDEETDETVIVLTPEERGTITIPDLVRAKEERDLARSKEEGGNSDTQQYDDSERYTKLDDNWGRTKAEKEARKERWGEFKAETLINLGVTASIPRFGFKDNPEKLDKLLRQNANRGDVWSFLDLGLIAKKLGQIDEAESWWSQAHDGGHERGSLNNAGMWEALGDLERAKKWLLKGAEAGHENAMEKLISLAQTLEDSDLFDFWTAQLESHNQSVKAAEHEAAAKIDAEAKELATEEHSDNPDSLYKLGRIYYHQWGKKEQARVLYEKAAQLGHAGAMGSLGFMAKYDDQDDAEAKRWYQSAAEAGSLTDCYSLGRLLINNGELSAGRTWLERAADGNYGSAITDLAEISYIEGDIPGAVELLSKYAENSKRTKEQPQ